MNGNGNKTQRVGDKFLEHMEDIMKHVKDEQEIELSFSKITNFITNHDAFKNIKEDTIKFNFKELKDKWQF